MANSTEIEQLLRELTSKDATICQKAREKLVEIGNPAVPGLKKLLLSGKDWERWEAAKTLSEMGDPEAVPALVESLRDKQFEVRWLAAKGLIKTGWKSAVPVIESLIEHPGSVWMRDGSHHVLHDIAHGPMEDPLQPMLKSIKGIEPAVNIPLVGRKVLAELKPLAEKLLREEEEARRKAEEEAAQAEADKKAEEDLISRLEHELGND